MPTARHAREWAADGGLRGIGNSLYTPFKGVDGDEIDYDAYRTLVRYCVRDLGHPMLWLTSGIAEWWSLTIAERKTLLEVAVAEARAVAPDTVIQACTAAASAKDCLELTLHAQANGAGASVPTISTSLATAANSPRRRSNPGSDRNASIKLETAGRPTANRANVAISAFRRDGRNAGRVGGEFGGDSSTPHSPHGGPGDRHLAR